MLVLLVIVHNLDLESAAVSPDEAYAPLIVDPDAVLPLAIASQGFQPIRGRGPKVVERACRIQHLKLTPCDLGDICGKPFREFPLENRGGALVTEALDHLCYIARNGRYVKDNITTHRSPVMPARDARGRFRRIRRSDLPLAQAITLGVLVLVVGMVIGGEVPWAWVARAVGVH